MDLTVTFTQGGKREYKRTGIYPQYVSFSSTKLRATWSTRFKTNPTKGNLLVGDEVLYRYYFTEQLCKIILVENGNEVGEWIELEIVHVMAD